MDKLTMKDLGWIMDSLFQAMSIDDWGAVKSWMEVWDLAWAEYVRDSYHARVETI